MTTQPDLARMTHAARLMSEVTGEDLLGGLIVGFDLPSADTTDGHSVVAIRGHDGTVFLLSDADALDLLTGRVWRAVQDTADANDWHIKVFPCRRISIQHMKGDICLPTDLTSAVDAVHKHWQENR